MILEVRSRLEREGERLASEGTNPRANWAAHLLDALPHVEGGMIRFGRAGFGSSLVLLDLASATEAPYRLLVGEDIDIEAGEVSIISPMGQALLGCRVGDDVRVSTPRGERRFRVLTLTTLPEILGMDEVGQKAGAH
jgi:transcription elongation GreA/GreB family factor